MNVPPLASYTRTLGQILATAEVRAGGVITPPDVDVPPWVGAFLAEAQPGSARALALLGRAVAAVERGDAIHEFLRATQPTTREAAAAFFADATPATLATIDAVCSERAPTSAQHLATLGVAKEASAAFTLVQATIAATRSLHRDEIAQGRFPCDLPSEPHRPRVSL